MIKTKKELDFYLKTDLMMNRGAFKKSLKVRLKDIIVPDYIMEYPVFEMVKQAYGKDVFFMANDESIMATKEKLKDLSALEELVMVGYRNIEEKGDDSWIVLTGFVKLNKSDDTELESHKEDNKSMIAIRLADVEYAEIFN